MKCFCAGPEPPASPPPCSLCGPRRACQLQRRGEGVLAAAQSVCLRWPCQGAVPRAVSQLRRTTCCLPGHQQSQGRGTRGLTQQLPARAGRGLSPQGRPSRKVRPDTVGGLCTWPLGFLGHPHEPQGHGGQPKLTQGHRGGRDGPREPETPLPSGNNSTTPHLSAAEPSPAGCVLGLHLAYSEGSSLWAAPSYATQDPVSHPDNPPGARLGMSPPLHP